MRRGTPVGRGPGGPATRLLAAAAVTGAVLLSSAGPATASTAATTTTSAGASSVGGERLATAGLVVDAPGATPLPVVGASAFLLADLTTGEVLAARDPHGQLRPASTQKILTALTLLPELDPDAVYTATQDDAAVDGSKAGMVPEATYTVHQMFQALFLVSGNDAASGLAQAAGGVPATVRAMNETARRLGALDTEAKNTSGLDAPGQVTSAYDLAVLARAAMARADFRAHVSTVKAQFPGKMPAAGKVRRTFEIYTQDRLLLNYPGAIGVKTGWTTKARGTFVGAATRDGRTLVATVLRTEGDGWRESGALLSWGFRNAALARPVGSLDAVPVASAGGGSGVQPAVDAAARASAPPTSQGGRGVPWWVSLPLALLAVVALLRARVLVRRARRRRRPGPLLLPRPAQSAARRRVTSPARPAPTAAPTTAPRTVRVLRDEPPSTTSRAPTGTAS